MVCPYCASETAVTNSRLQRRNNQIWRRRRCISCKAIFTTHEVIELSTAFLVKKAGSERPFLKDKLFKDVLDSLRGHERPYEAARELTDAITRNLTKNAAGGLISSQEISSQTAKVLRRFDKQAYLRYSAEHPSVQA